MSFKDFFSHKKATMPLYIVSFFNSLVFFAPVALFVRTRCGITLSQFFYLQVISSLCVFALEIPCGVLTDKIGYKKSLILAQLLLTTVRLLFFIGDNFYLFALASVIEATSICFESGTTEAYYYTLFGEEKYLKVSSIASSFATASFIISTLLFVPINAFLGMNYLLLFTLFSHIIALIASFFQAQPVSQTQGVSQPTHAQEKQNTKKLIKKIVTNPALIAIFFVSSFLSLGVYIVNFFFIIKLEECGINENAISAVILGYSAIKLLSPLIVPRLEKRSEKASLPALFALNALLTFALYKSTNYAVFAPMLLLPLVMSLPRSLLSKAQNKLIDALELGENRATVLSVLNQGANLCDVVFLFLASAAANVNMLFLGTAILFLLLAILTALRYNK